MVNYPLLFVPRWLRSGVSVSITRGCVTRRHAGATPAGACTESPFCKIQTPRELPFPPFLAPAEIHRLLQSSFPEQARSKRAGAVGTFSNQGPLETEVCRRSRMESGAMLRPAGLSAAARSPTLGDSALPCADPKNNWGWMGRASSPQGQGLGVQRHRALCSGKWWSCTPVACLPPPLCFPHPSAK